MATFVSLWLTETFLDGMPNVYVMSLRSHSAFHKQDTDGWLFAFCLKNRLGMREQKSRDSGKCVALSIVQSVSLIWAFIFIIPTNITYEFSLDTYWLLLYCCSVLCDCVSYAPWAHRRPRTICGKLGMMLHLDLQLMLHAAEGLPNVIAIPNKKEKKDTKEKNNINLLEF